MGNYANHESKFCIMVNKIWNAYLRSKDGCNAMTSKTLIYFTRINMKNILLSELAICKLVYCNNILYTVTTDKAILSRTVFNILTKFAALLTSGQVAT